MGHIGLLAVPPHSRRNHLVRQENSTAATLLQSILNAATIKPFNGNDAMAIISDRSILEAVRRVAQTASQPARIIVFGSYGRGDADEGSDLDLLVIEPHIENKAEEYLKLHRAVGSIGIGVDLLVYSQDEFERRSQVQGTLPYWANKEGKLLHDPAA
jgi:predicted nucleotidyltransferase